MRYIFENGQYPNQVEIDDREFPDDDAAHQHAISIGADYAWDVPEDRNPSSLALTRQRPSKVAPVEWEFGPDGIPTRPRLPLCTPAPASPSLLDCGFCGSKHLDVRCPPDSDAPSIGATEPPRR